ncbi:MAG TPA: glycoside hydrolase family 95 protein, partial [Sedimentisphaerales bacterium]
MKKRLSIILSILIIVCCITSFVAPKHISFKLSEKPTICDPDWKYCDNNGSMCHDANGNLSLHFDNPSQVWETEGLPIGNGQLGAMLLGNPGMARIQFNEESLWLGDEDETGKYQNFGDLIFRFGESKETPRESGYRRSLDIANAICRASWTRDGASITQEAFASFPAKVIVVRWRADKPGALSGVLQLVDAHGAKTEISGDIMTIAGDFPGYTYDGGKQWLPLHREAQVRVLHSGGSVIARDSSFIVEKADEVTLFLTAGTDFKQDRSANWRGEMPHETIAARLKAATKKSYDELRSEHLRDYHRLFDRVTLSLGGVASPDISTDVRLKQYRTDQPDLGLEELLFQYGRYLLISSSREGGLPANLQGKWNDKNDPPWRCDYHTDVNVEMNYWMADVANLGECFQPYAAWIQSIRAVRIEATKKAFDGARGW